MRVDVWMFIAAIFVGIALIAVADFGGPQVLRSLGIGVMVGFGGATGGRIVKRRRAQPRE